MTTVAEARLRACKLWPYGSHAILSLVPVSKPGLGTMAVDQHWRLYYDPKTVEESPVDESAGIILHEVSHLLLKHHRRAETMLGKDASDCRFQRWNVATDYAINSMLREQGIKLWDGVLYPEQDGFVRGLSGEEYYRLLTAQADYRNEQGQNDWHDSGEGPFDSREEAENFQNAEVGADSRVAQKDDGWHVETKDNQEPGDQGASHDPDETTGNGQGSEPADSGTGSNADDRGGEGSNSAGAEGHGDQRTPGMERPAAAPGCGDGGSCADGRQRPWELPAPSQCDTPGLKPHEADIIVRETADRILEKQCGEGTGGWRQWAQNVINPRVDPRTALLRMVRQAVEVTSGQGDYSYRRPNRRNPRRDLVRPSTVQPIPRITVIADTSGSMDQRDLGLSLGLIGKVLNGFRIRDGIRVVCGDIKAVVSARVFNPKQVILAGGGGTDMGKLIQEVAKSKPLPQLIVVCTDGETPWCAPVGIPVVACVTRERYAKRVPSWIKTVVLAE